MSYTHAVAGTGDTARAADEHLGLFEERLRALFAASTDGLVLVDAAGRVEQMSPAAEVMTGWPERDAAGHALDEVVRALCESTREPWRSPAAHALATGELATSAGRVVLCARGGDERPIGATAAPVLGAGGAVVGVALVLHDHEDIRRADEAAELLGGLASSLAHEVNNPLASVVGSLDYLSHALAAGEIVVHGSAAEVEDALRTARSGAELIRRLVHELRAGQTGRATLPPPRLAHAADAVGAAAAHARAAMEPSEHAARPVTTTVVRTTRVTASGSTGGDGGAAAGGKPSTPTGAAADPGAGPAAARARLLIIDDDPLVGTSLRRVLSREFAVTVELGARDALARVASGEAFEVILCDLMMPEMTGMEFHAEITRMAPSLAARMVFLTGGAYTSQARDFLASVPNPRLQKPFDAQLLRAVVREVLAAHPPAP